MKEKSLYTHAYHDGVLEIKLTGEIDHHSAVGVRGELDKLICTARPQRVVLDLSEISFMDSSGLGLIMGRYSLIKELGGSLALRSPTRAVMRILSLAGMDRIVGVEKVKGGIKNEKK